MSIDGFAHGLQSSSKVVRAWVSQQHFKSIEGSWNSGHGQYSLACVLQRSFSSIQRSFSSIPVLTEPGPPQRPRVVSGWPQKALAGPWDSREFAGASLGCSDRLTELLGYRSCHRRQPRLTNTAFSAFQLPAASDGDWSWLQLRNKLLKGCWRPEFAPTDITHRSFHVDESRKSSMRVSVLTVEMSHGQRNGSCDNKSLH